MLDIALLELASRQHGLVEWTQAITVVTEKLLAACLAAGPDSAVSHRAAAHDWELGRFPGIVEIVTPRANWPRLRHVRVHRSHDLRA